MKLTIKIFVGAFATIGVASTVAMLATPAFAQEKDDEAHEKTGALAAPAARVSPVQAMKAAERKTGGKAALATFEFDEGQWSYGVIVAKNHKLMEIEIDPMSGKVLDSETVTPAGEAKEFEQELAKLAKS